MGKRARKPKKMGDGSLATVTCTNSMQLLTKPKKKLSSMKRMKQDSRCDTDGFHSATMESAVSSAISSFMAAGGHHSQGEDEDVDIMGNDDILQPDLHSHSALSCQFTVKEEDDSCGPDRPLGAENLRPDVFDQSYELHNGLSCLPDYDMAMNSGVEPSRPEYLPEDALVPTSIAAQNYIQCSLPSFGLAGDNPCTTLNDSKATLHASMSNAVGGCVPENSPLMIPTSLVGAGQGATATTTAFAQVTKIEEGPDGKGYVLHLNIPALGLTNVVLSTPGLSLAPGMDEKILAAGTTDALPTLLNMATSGGTAASPEDIIRHEQLSDEGMDNNSGSNSPSDHLIETHSSMDDQVISCGPTDGHMMEPDHADDVMWDDEENMLLGGHPGIMEGSSSSSSSDSGCGLSADQEAGSSGSGSGPETDSHESNSALVNVARWVEKPEVERFVICSDGPMECVLCAFKTLDYSAFKSHIICSHPCWRITKKLSKNRLLVEKSVKMNVNLVPQTVVPQNARGRRPSKDKDSACASNDEGCPSNVSKSKKGLQVYQRKKQMLERNKRLFRCSVCMRLFVFEGSIVNHIVDIHLVKTPYDHIQVSNNHGMSFEKIRRCSHDNCYASCLTEEELERHRIESHAQVVYRCQICGFTADSSDAIEKHASLIHNQYDLMYGLVD